MINQIYTLKPLGEGADPATFYAPLGCSSSVGRFYRRNVQYGEDGAPGRGHVEVCFFSKADGLSDWKASAVLMAETWFVPISAEATLALDAYKDKLGPVNMLTRDLDYKNASLSGARSRLKLLESSSSEVDDLLEQGSPKQREVARDIAGLEAEVAQLAVVLKRAEAKRQEAQDALLAALGWEALAGVERGENGG